MPETKDTILGLLRRTGPAMAELFDSTTGNAYRFNFAAFAATSMFDQRNGKELTDEIFLPEPKATGGGSDG